MNWLPYILIVIGVVLSTIGGFWLSHISSREVKHELQTVKTELTIKNDKIQELNNFILSSITGGDSFCYVEIGSIAQTNDHGLLVLIHQGKYPLYDLNIRIVDLDKFDEIKDKLSFEKLASMETRLNLGNLSPGFAQMLGPISFPGKTNLRFNIFATARNGETAQVLRIRLIDNKWVRANKVTKSFTNEVIYEKIDKEYPRDPEGNVLWD
jgi:hypothetical protein